MNKPTRGFKTFLLLWFGQTISLIGSALTALALTIWVFQEAHTVTSVALLLICNFVPAALVALFAGSLIDRLPKKPVMLIADSVAAMTTVFLLCAYTQGWLRVEHLYVVNAILGVTGAFQGPASAVVISALVPKDDYLRASGLQSFSGSLKDILAPVLATTVYAFGGLSAVLVIDLSTFAFAFVTLCLLKIPEQRVGFRFLGQHKGVLHIIFYLMLINFIAGIGYYSLLTPMILARTGGNEIQLGFVTTCIGLGAMVGALALTFVKPKCRRVTLMGVAYTLSFLGCDLWLGVGRSVWVWCVAAFLGNLPLPFGDGALTTLLRENVPIDMQGRVFATRSALCNLVIVAGYLVSAWLADHVVEPFAAADNPISAAARWLVGTGDGRAMGLVFVATCVIGVLASMTVLRDRHVRALEQGDEGDAGDAGDGKGFHPLHP